MPEMVYILTNPTIPDLVKIGRTSNLEERLRSLSSHSGVPVPFECFYACEVEHSQDVEKRLHFGLGDHRINPKREFFRINPERVKMLLEGWAIREVTPGSDIVDSREEQDSLDRERSRRPVFRFSMVDIPLNSTIAFLHDESIVATVLGDREIHFNGTRTSLSKVTLELINTQLGRNWTTVRGPDYWIYENETLTDRRLRMEKEIP